MVARNADSLVSDPRPQLLGMNTIELTTWLSGALGISSAQAPLRARQLYHWLYARGAITPADMTTLPKSLRLMIANHAEITRPTLVAEQISRDGTRKWLLRFTDGR